MASEFYKNFTHDILNITGRMQSAVSLLDPSDPPSTDDIALVRKLIEQDSQKLSQAMRLFCFGEWFKSAPPLQSEEVDTLLMLEEIIQQCQTEQENPIVLQKQDQPWVLKSDQNIVQPLLEELIKNALVHRAENTKIQVHVHCQQRSIDIINIPITQLPNNCSSPLIKRAESPGMGLGLSFAFQAAQYLGGHLEVMCENNLVITKLKF